LRLFFALWPDAAVARQFTALTSQFNFEQPARMVDPKNYHVTVAFVGEVATARLESLQQIGRSLQARAFSMRFEAIENWPQARAVVAVVHEMPHALGDLWRGLRAAIGFESDMPFRAHVTLARNVPQAPVHAAMSTIIWRVANFSLIRSDTGGIESSYTVVDTWPLLYES
jgi:RNA 2',3'-cyclic 3'-phosphodiesterase